jgi:hypothetical protein
MQQNYFKMNEANELPVGKRRLSSQLLHFFQRSLPESRMAELLS